MTKMSRVYLFILFVIFFSIGLSACGVLLSTIPNGEIRDPLGTAAAATVNVILTESSRETKPTITPIPSSPTSSPTSSGATSALGLVQGGICYPSETIPAMVAYFEEIHTGALMTMPIAANQISYQQPLPAGTYQVYAWGSDFGELGGAYTEMVKCGLHAGCTDHSLAQIEIRQGKTTNGVDICDWYGGQGAVPYPPTYKPTEIPPTPTIVPAPCDLAQFVKDLTINDGTTLNPGEGILKEWRLKNLGSCTWTPDYDLVFVGGDRLGADQVVPLPGYVQPGQTIDLAVRMVAPEEGGRYRGYWQLRNSNGVLFGFGDSGRNNFWVDIRVRASYSTTYDFANAFCDAEWFSGAGPLPCPGDSGNSAGFVQYLDFPDLENRQEDEPALWTRPDLDEEGWVRGVYPLMKVKDGDRFRAWVGCMDGREGCLVEFRLDYEKRNGQVKNLGIWKEAYDGQVTVIDLDLSELADMEIRYILQVRVLENSDKADAFWFVPHIDRLHD